MASVRRLFWDSVVLDPEYLGYVAAKVGADRLLLGSDHPFSWEPDPVATVAAALPPEDVTWVVGRTAQALFGL